ncbi:FecCD family ABC transporter permease [bacterium RCC_150]
MATTTAVASRTPRRRFLNRLTPGRALAAFLVLDVALGLYSLSVSGSKLPFADAMGALFGQTNDFSRLVLQNQLPRVLLCFIAGATLGIAGGVTQGVIRNPLASPDIIGVSKGAAVGAAAVILVFPTVDAEWIPAGAFVGGVLSFLLVYVLAYRKGVAPVRLALTGIAVGAVADSLIRFMLVKWPTNINAALVWLVGSLYGHGQRDVVLALPWLLVLVPAILYLARRMDVLSLGDDLAAGLGEAVERTRFLTLILAVAAASVATSVAGTVGFIGLIAPHIAKQLVGGQHAKYLPLSAAIGVLLLLVGDTLGRGLLPPLEIPAGLILAFLGGPYFLYLMVKTVR